MSNSPSTRRLTNWLKAWMEFTRETESPDQYHFWVGCSLIAAATKRQVLLDMHQFQIYPNTYIILVGPSGARKSIATGIGMNLATKVGLKKFSDKITGAALIRDLSQATEKAIEANKNGDGGGSVEIRSPLIIYSSELGVFMGPDAYGSGVIADLTDLYDCPKIWEKKTISRDSEQIIAPYITMLAASTPQTLKDVVPIGAVGQGFTSRVLFIWAPGRRKRVPIPPWGLEYEVLELNLVRDLQHIATLRGNFEFSSDGLNSYKRHYMEHPEPEEEFEDERLRGYASRKDIHTLKVAMLLSLANKDELIITKEDFEGAVDAIKWVDSGLSSVFAGHGSAASAEDVVRIFKQIEMATSSGRPISHSELVRRNYVSLNSTEFAVVIETLKQANAIEERVTQDPATQQYGKYYKAIDSSFIKQIKGVMPKQFNES